LVTGTKTAIVNNLYYASGVLIDSTVTYAYISENQYPSSNYVVSKVNLATGVKSSFSPVFTFIYSLTWTDSTQTSILVNEPNSNAVYLLSISQTIATATAVYSATLPESTAISTPGQLLIVQDSQITLFSLSDSTYNSLGPSLLGIGNIPVTAVSICAC
jgi:hypothetical protein